MWLKINNYNSHFFVNLKSVGSVGVKSSKIDASY